MRLRALGPAGLLVGLFVLAVRADDEADFFKPAKPQDKPPAGKAEMLRHVPKKFAAFLAADAVKLQVTLHIEGEKEPTTWPLNPDAEIKVRGWWGRLSQFQKGQRVWVWFAVDRKRQPKAVLMLADEVSEQDIHGTPPTFLGLDEEQKTVVIETAKGKEKVRTLALPPGHSIRREDDNRFGWLWDDPHTGLLFRDVVAAGDKVFVQSAGDRLLWLNSEKGVETARRLQQTLLRETVWQKEGLPGSVALLHPLAGEFEFVLDHEAMRWGRSLKKGDKVTLKTAEPIEAVVKEVAPWRERTRLTLVADGFVQSELSPGQRLNLHMPTPAGAVDAGDLPPDIDRPRAKEERIEWFLASVYCTCNVKGDNCTGMFYTLASCNVHACGAPNQFRARLAGLIDKGLSNRQIWDELKKSEGPLLTRPHLLQ